MKKHLFLKTLLVLIGILIGSVSTNLWGASYLYLKPTGTGYGDWASGGERYAAYFYGASGNSWVNMNQVQDGLYIVEIPASNAETVIFCRMNGGNNTNNWDNKWNQTADLTVSGNEGKAYNASNSSSSWDANAISVYTNGQTLYLLTNSDWRKDNARFAVCFGDGAATWVSMSQVGSTDYYSVTVPNNHCSYAIFCRMNGANNTNSWSNKWNQTSNMEPSSGKNGVEITASGDNNQSWIVVYTGLSVARNNNSYAAAPSIDQTLIKSGSSVSVSAGNATTGYHWVNWTSSNGSFGTATNKSTTFTPTANSAVATANYSINQRYVRFNANGGSGSMSAQTFTYGVAQNLTANSFTKTGYGFAGWATASDGDVVYSNSYNLTLNPSEAEHGTYLDLYAKWTASTYDVTLDPDEGSSTKTVVATYDAAMPSKYKNSETSVAAPSFDGYAFQGYYDDHAGAGTQYYNSSAASARTWNKASTATLYAKWTQTVTLSKNTSAAGATNGSAGVTYKKSGKTSFTAATRTGYTCDGYYTAASSGYKVIAADGTMQSTNVNISSFIGTSDKWVHSGATTLYAYWTANNYTVTLKPNGATTGSDQTVSATYDSSMPGTTTASAAVAAPSKTGYNFTGFWDNSTNGSGTKYYNANLSSARNWDKAVNSNLWAQWSAKSYTLTLDIDEDNHGTIDGKDTEASVTFDAAPTAIAAGKLPTAANGYCFMGFFTATAGGGVKIINADGTWVSDEDGYMSSGKWVRDGEPTLYAYYKKAEISIALDKTTAAPWSALHPDSITVTATISPTPVGSPRICWYVLQNNNNPLAPQPSFRELSSNQVRFPTYTESGTYKVAAVLRIGGSDCEDGTKLDGDTVNFIIAGSHTVTVQYKSGSDVIRAASSETVGALDSVAITAPEITGYTFSYWQFGEGVFSNKIPENKDTVRNVNPIKVVATYDGTLTANYTKKKMVYFNNTLDWDTVYVYFYNNASGNRYWADGYGTGANKNQEFIGNKPFWQMHYGGMKRVAPGSNIWYFDWVAEGWSEGDISNNITFANIDQALDVTSGDNDKDYFHNAKVVFRQDYSNRTTLPMFVPLNEVTNDFSTNTGSKYYSNGYWMNYPENTGYTLKIYTGTTKNVSDELQSIPFEFTGDKTFPMELTVELNAGTTYGFEIKRNDGTYYGYDGTMKSGNSGDDSGWAFSSSSTKRCGIKTSVAGDYTFKLSYSSTNYLVGVHYPASTNDYRIVYNDRVAWSQADAHDANWYHPSRTIHKENGAEDIVSFYVSKAPSANASMKFQYASEISNEGVVTWSDVDGGSIDLSGITKSGVYNFYLTQEEGNISVSKIEPYTGNYYIRTKYAGSSGWDNYRASDHQMTYSEFSKHRSTNTFGDLFSHYYAHWCERKNNIRFTVANDYSSAITDTLAQDQYPSINYFSNLTSDGELYYENTDWVPTYDDANAFRDKYSANIRFMYNDSTNMISRAYVSSATDDTRRFLVLAGTDKLRNNDADATTIPATANLEANAILFNDDQNFMYEITVKAIPSARIKLYAKYVNESQYFRGIDDAGDFDDDDNTVELIGGDPEGAPQKVKVVYDFKTNRLVTAWEPDGTDITGTVAINADIMINRDHQDAGATITFGENGKLDEVKTVYGTMTFNRWILNNRANPTDMTPESCADAAAIASNHPVLAVANQKSIYERSLYFISFPFDVKLSEVFGFGKYWDEWYLEYYDGKGRAKNGYWIDSEPNWKYVMPSEVNDFVMKANEGYILGLDLDYMKADNFDFWTNKSSQVILYFPSTANIDEITSTAVTLPALGSEYECKINRGDGTEGDRRVKDSYWRCIGVPGYSSYSSTLTKDEDGENTITWQTNTEWHADLENYPFLYEWNPNDNTLTAQSTSNYTFKAMHAYLVQNKGAIHWSAVSATPVSSIVARRSSVTRTDYSWCLTLEHNGIVEDQTHIRMTDNENVTDGFDFGPDMSKELNAGRSDIYTLIGYERAAANSMPLHENETTIIPVGLNIEATGEYTFAIPEGTDGIGVKLNDTETGEQTNLSAGMVYTLTLNKGDYTNRFFLEISPIKNAPTGIENTEYRVQNTEVRKVMIDGLLYIVKDGVIYDAQGRQVK